MYAFFCFFIFIGSSHAASLFKAYPALREQIPHIQLAALPTALFECTHLSTTVGCTIYCKDESNTGGTREFGGNKVRKLEFLLADAVQKDATEILTYGCFGSNHAVATSWWAHKIGFSCSCILFKQPLNSVFLRNLLLHVALTTKVYCAYSADDKKQIEQEMESKTDQNGRRCVYAIPVGGSNALGTLGYVNAAFELYEQYAAINQPLPDVIIVAAGSCGTAAGLAVGLRMRNYQGQLVLIAVQKGGGKEAFIEKLTKLAQETNELLHTADKAIPLFDWQAYEWMLLNEYVGQGYAYSTTEGDYAQQLFYATEQLKLDPVYTAKAAAGMLGYLKQHPETKSLLFLNTFCADSFQQLIKKALFLFPQSVFKFLISNFEQSF